MFLFQYISFKFARLGLVIFYVFLGVACSAPDSELADQASQLNKTSKSIRLDTLFETLAEQGFQGGAVLAKDGEVLWSGSYGKADIKTGRSLDSDSIYELASVGKSYTAMAVLTLVEKNKLELNATAKSYLENFPYSDITIEHLLTHTSGLPDYTESLSEEELPNGFSNFLSNEDIILWLASGQDDRLFQGGEKFSYSNSNYIALALIIEIASGQTFAEYLTDNVFKPLGMLHTSSFTERFTSGDIPTNYAFGYVTNEMGEMELPESLPSNKFLPVLSTLEGDGTVIGRLNDFSKWEPAWTTDILIGARLRQKALSPYRLNDSSMSEYGYGWRTDSKKNLVFHWGGWPGYSTGVYLDPETRTIIAYALTAPFNNWEWIGQFEALAFE